MRVDLTFSLMVGSALAGSAVSVPATRQVGTPPAHLHPAVPLNPAAWPEARRDSIGAARLLLSCPDVIDWHLEMKLTLMRREKCKNITYS